MRQLQGAERGEARKGPSAEERRSEERRANLDDLLDFTIFGDEFLYLFLHDAVHEVLLHRRLVHNLFACQCTHALNHALAPESYLYLTKDSHVTYES